MPQSLSLFTLAFRFRHSQHADFMMPDRFDTARSMRVLGGVVPSFTGAALIGLYGNAISTRCSSREVTKSFVDSSVTLGVVRLYGEDKYAREDLGVQNKGSANHSTGMMSRFAMENGGLELFPEMVIGRESLSLFVILAARGTIT
jgi:hypothetical protein